MDFLLYAHEGRRVFLTTTDPYDRKSLRWHYKDLRRSGISRVTARMHLVGIALSVGASTRHTQKQEVAV